ncbi:MAG TPA: S1 RNA-binding domain-containing protein, partial [Bacteroidales bacterium]|nr:S1 RNA-binding domain-containing protein [Bacteroidales bacterium]
MTDTKKKSGNKDNIERNDDEFRAEKKPKIKEANLMQEIEEELLDTELPVRDSADAEVFAEPLKAAGEQETDDLHVEDSDDEVFSVPGIESVQGAVPDIRGTSEAARMSPEDFDWDSFEKDELKNSPRHKEYEAMYDKTLSTIAVDEVVQGTVIQMTPREVVINIGYKSEGVVSLNEFRYNPNLKVGDVVEVYVESQEDKKGQLVLSHKKARAINSWDRVNASLENDEIITGYIKCRTKGGMIVD